MLTIKTTRSCRTEVFCKKGVLKNFAKFTGKHLCQRLFLIKFQKPPATLLKKRFWRKCFPVNLAKFLRTPFFIDHLRWLFLGTRTTCLWLTSNRFHTGDSIVDFEQANAIWVVNNNYSQKQKKLPGEQISVQSSKYKH